MNARLKDPASHEISFLLAFPDVYEVGMSHLGSQIIYHVVNSLPHAACDRAYAPWFDMEALMRANGWPLFGIESRIPAGAFDIIGFSLEYELCYTNVLTMLDLAGVPRASADRDESHPLVIAGGPSCMSPEPLTKYIDAFCLGDGEEVVVEVIRTYREWKSSQGSRADLLWALSEIEGVYVPSLYRVSYKADGTVLRVEPETRNGKSAPEKIRRRVVANLENSPYPLEPLIPAMEPVHDRAMVEIFRGCSRGCRFCQAGIIYRPVREKSGETVLAHTRKLLKTTGYNEVSLVSLSSADYTQIQRVLSDLLQKDPCQTRVSLPSLRVDSFSVDLATLLAAGEKSGLTLAPEAGSQRMRDCINKQVTDEDILEAASRAFEAGFDRIKLYFMIGLPGETDEDVRAIASMASRVRQIGRDLGRRPTVVVSVSGFVPKAHTPFQWEKTLDESELQRRQKILASMLKGPGLEFRYHDARLTQLEAVFSRGDRRLSAVLEQAHAKGCRFDSWPDFFQYEKWESSFAECGVDPLFYANREREVEEILPWDHIDSGVSRAFLLRERERAKQGELTPDCRWGPCSVCGICGTPRDRVVLSK